MTAKQFYDRQTAGGTDDVMRFVDGLERAGVAWCAIGAAVLSMLLTAAPAAAQAEVVIYGIGKQPCSAWVQSKASAGDRRVHLAWMQGYLSAAAVYRPEETFLQEMTDKAILSSMDTYCGEHPRRSVLDAAAWYVRQLVKVKTPR